MSTLELLKEIETETHNPKFSILLENAKEEKKHNFDYTTELSNENIYLDDKNSRLIIKDLKLDLNFYEHGFSTFCSSLNIPAGFVKTLPSNILQDIVRYKLDKNENKQVFIRTKDSETLRSIHSSKFAVYDNYDLLKNISNALTTELDDYEVRFKTYTKYDGGFNLKILFPELETEENHNIGMVIRNSEIGISSIQVMPFIHRLPCTNDLVYTNSAFKQNHIHFKPEEMDDKVTAAIIQTMHNSDKKLTNLLELQNKIIKNPYTVLENLAEKYKLNDKKLNLLKESYDIEPMSNQFGIIQSFTRASQQMNMRERLYFEMLAGKISESNFKKLDYLDNNFSESVN